MFPSCEYQPHTHIALHFDIRELKANEDRNANVGRQEKYSSNFTKYTFTLVTLYVLYFRLNSVDSCVSS